MRQNRCCFYDERLTFQLSSHFYTLTSQQKIDSLVLFPPVLRTMHLGQVKVVLAPGAAARTGVYLEEEEVEREVVRERRGRERERERGGRR